MIAYYITAHGYGHGTRSCDILNALRAADPETPIVVKTDLPVNFLKSRLPDSFDIQPGAFDIGLIQKDSIQVDLEASLDAIERLYSREEKLIEQEIRFIEQENVNVVVADIPAIPLKAAQQAGIANIATGNFSWNWIYSDFVKHDPRWAIYVEKFRDVYAQTHLLLRQPFAEPMSAFPNQIDLPLLSNPGVNHRELIAEMTGADHSKKWALLSFTTLDLDDAALTNLSNLNEVELFTVDPLRWPNTNIHCLSRSKISFSNVLASVDVVITKPGFGIISECIANDKPIIYSDRKNFLEYDVLVENIKRYCHNAFLPSSELYAGRLSQALAEIESAPAPPETMLRGGAELAAKYILEAKGN